jgi:hypothetical protein
VPALLVGIVLDHARLHGELLSALRDSLTLAGATPP